MGITPSSPLQKLHISQDQPVLLDLCGKFSPPFFFNHIGKFCSLFLVLKICVKVRIVLNDHLLPFKKNMNICKPTHMLTQATQPMFVSCFIDHGYWALELVFYDINCTVKLSMFILDLLHYHSCARIFSCISGLYSSLGG